MRRFMSVILAAFCLFLLTSTVVFAVSLEPSTLTVIMKYGDTVLSGQGVAICRVADARERHGGVIYTATQEFSGAGADFTNLTAERTIALAASLNTYASVHDIGRSTMITDRNGKAVFTDLSAGLYLVAQTGRETSRYIFEPFLVAVPGYSETAQDGWIYDVIAYPKTEPVRPDVTTISVSVYKIWVGTDAPPDSISVQLYRNGNPYGSAVVLSAGNYWSYTWENLDPNYTWTVDESDIPDGYTKIISGNARSGFIITNTKETAVSPSPSPSESPIPSLSPSPTPTETTLETPTIPVEPPPSPKETTLETPHIPGEPLPSSKEPGGEPKTEDTGNMPLWIALTFVCSVGLIAMVFVIISKRKGRNRG